MPDISEILSRTEELSKDASDILKVQSNLKIETLEQRLSLYAEVFFEWQADVEVIDPSTLDEEQKNSIKAAINTLTTVHQELVSIAESRQQNLGEELSSLHKRGKAVKTYADRFPSRVSVTGKRKG